MKDQYEKELIDKYLAGLCNPEEEKIIESWYLWYAKEKLGRSNELDEPAYISSEKEIWKAIQQRNKAKVRFLISCVTAAASILLLLTAGVYFIRYQSKQQQTVRHQIPDIAPGRNKAFLTLANGSKIDLDAKGNGLIAKQAGLTITKTKDGQLIYKILNHKPEPEKQISYNTIETPKGGQYEISLPDGTKVWLNASSSLKYPTQFAAHERLVQLTGEGYFEVAKNKARPFKVLTVKQEIEVLGTHFNVNAYTNESAVKTTLLEGSVKIKTPLTIRPAILKPGQQSTLNTDLTIENVDAEDAVAWKNGLTTFKNADIKSVMRQLERWYDVEVTYSGNISEKRVFTGEIARNTPLSEVFKVLELSNIHFTIEGKRVIVSP